MPKRFAHSPRYYYYLLAITVIVIAVMVQSLRLLAPKINSLRPSIEQLLSEELNAQVSIGHVDASWYGLRPHVLVSDLSVRGMDDNTSDAHLRVAYADFTVDLLQSVLNYQWVWRNVVFKDIHVDLEQNPQGQWRIAGLPVAQKGNSRWRYRHPSELFKTVAQIDLHNANLHITFSNNKVIHTQIPSIAIENTDDFHRLTASASVQNKDVFTLVLEEQSGDKKDNYMSGFVRLDEFPIEDIVSGLTENKSASVAILPSASTVSTSLWFDFTSENIFDVVGDISLAGFSDTSTPSLLNFPISSQVKGRFDAVNGWSLGLRDVLLDDTLMVNQAALEAVIPGGSDERQWRLLVDSLVINAWLPWLKKHILTQEKAQAVIDTMAPQGHLTQLSVDINMTDWKASVVSANIHDASVQPFENIPGIQRVNGYVSSSLSSGFIDLSSKQLQFFPANVYEQPLLFDSIYGQVAWHLFPDRNQIIVNSSNLTSDSIFGQANGYFFLDLPWEKDSRKSNFILQIGVQESKSEHAFQFIPTKVPESLREWLSASVLKGNVEQAGFIYRGGFSDENNARSIQLFLDVDDVDLAYSADWPDLTDASGHVLVDNEYTQVIVNQANIRDEPVEALQVTWLGDKRKELNVAVKSTVSADLGLYYLNNTFLRKKVGDTFSTWTADGRIGVDVDINIPLLDTAVDDGIAPKQQVDIQFLDNNIHLTQQKLSFKNVKGELFYSETQGLYTDNLSLVLFDQLLPITVNQTMDNEGDGEYISVKGRSEVAIKPLSEWLEVPELSLLSGRLPYALELQVPLDNRQETSQQSRKKQSIENNDYLAKLVMTSNLQGVLSVLPEPLNKKTAETRHLTVNAYLRSAASNYHFQLDDVVDAHLVLGDQSASAAVALGQRAQLPPIENKTVSIAAVLNNVAVDEWQQVYILSQTARSQYDTREQSSAASILRYDLFADVLQMNDQQIPKVHVVGTKRENQWRAKVKNDWLAGDVAFDDSFTQPINIELDYLHIAALEDDQALNEAANDTVDPLADVDVSLVKRAKIRIDDLSYQNKALGQWRFDITPVENGIHIHDIYGNQSDMSLLGAAEGEGASLLWVKQKDAADSVSYSQFNGEISGSGIEQLFVDLGYPPLVKSKETELIIDVAWQGSPANFAVKRLTGNTYLSLKNGLFVQTNNASSTGALRLLGLFNFNTWARRLKLDFSDLYKKGMAFDNVTSRLVFDDGFIYFQEPLFLKGPSGEFTLAGQIDYPNESIDSVLVTTLPVGGNLTFAAAFAAGLPAAAGVYIVSKIFKPQVDKVSSLTYAIKGSWNDPDVKFIRLFDNDVNVSPDEVLIPSGESLENGGE
jgi:uncharacterized protein (TIGR02099 family)